MKLRPLGRSGIQVSEVGMGGHREGVETRGGIECTARFFQSDQDRARVVGAALDAGITYLDTTYYCEIQSLGRSLRLLNRRDGLCVSGMRVDFFANYLKEKIDIRAYVRREVEACLTAFGFEHVEQYMCGAMEQGDPLSHGAEMGEALDEFSKLQKHGKLRVVGFSTHDPDYGARLLAAFPAFNTVMTPYNFANRAAEGDLAQVVRRQQAAWVAMKTLVWHIYGVPVTVLRHLRPVANRLNSYPHASIGRLAVQFVLSNPLLSTCVPAINSESAGPENASASGLPLTTDQTETLQQLAEVMKAEDFVPLAIAALHEKNGRILTHALGLLQQRLGLPIPRIDWEADSAEQQAIGIATDLLRQFRKDPKWSGLLA